ncbi:hypothetical protein OAR00_00655 [Alphaproteobacteria bacterium]|nr:hypothetical protein [Alphaproteobacteria bacterium]
MNKIKMIISYKNLLLIFLLLSNTYTDKIFANENYVVSTVNKLPITKIDVIERAKVISFSIDQDLEFKNLKNFYNQSLKTLTNERVILSNGLKINKNINKIVSKKAYQLALRDFDNSESKLDQFINELSISKSTIVDKFKSQLIWSTILRNRFKKEIKNTEEKSKRIYEKQEVYRKKNLYDIAEIVLEQKGNSRLLQNISLALKQGSGFLEIAKQVSISSSAKFNGRIGWKTYENLPDYIIDKNIKPKEGDIISFPFKNKIKIIKILVKRNNGRLSEIENIITLAQINFQINFKKKSDAYIYAKEKVIKLLNNKINCNNLKLININKYQGLNLNIVNTRIADLSPNIQKIIKNKKLYEISAPMFSGNNGYAYIKCAEKKAKLKRNNYAKIKKDFMAKQFLIFSEKLINKLNKQANIINIEKFK